MRERARHYWRDILVAALAVLGVSVYVGAAAALDRAGFPLDDSWIHQTYARNLAQRGEWAFIPGETSVASTSPLYTVALALGYALHIPFFVWTFALGALTLAGAGWIAIRLAERVFPGVPQVGLWTGLAMVLAWHLVWAAASGMETMLFCTLALAVMGLACQETVPGSSERLRHGVGRGFGLGLAGAALTLTRPEGVGLVALAGLAVLLAQPRGDRRILLAWGGGLLAGWAVLVVPYLIFNYHVSGALLPNTSAAKQAENAPALRLPLWERYGRLLLPLVAGGQLLLLGGVGVALTHLYRRARRDRGGILFFLPLGWIVLDVSAYALRLPAPYQHGRYVMPILPFVLLYGVGGTLRIVQAGRGSPLKRVLSRSLGLSAALVMVAFWGIGAQVYGRDVRIINTEMVDTARWVNRNLPPEQLLAVHDIGALGYYAPRPIVDLAGLVTPEVVPIILDHEAVMQLMCERQVRYLMVLPDQLPTAPDDPRLGPEPVFVTNAPYAPAAGAGNMAVYGLHWPPDCGVGPGGM